MKAHPVLVLPALFVCRIASAQMTPVPDDNPPYVPPPATPKPHVVDVPQPGQRAPDTNPAAATSSSGDNLDPAKIAEYQARFQQGYELEQTGKLKEARDIFDGILAEQPQAKRSLLEAGRISFRLGELARANDYLDKLHQIVPDFPEAIELLIQINQALGRDVKVELLIRDFTTLRDSGKIPDLTHSICFVRERIPSGRDTIVVSQFFHYTEDPNTVWMGEVVDPAGNLKQRVLLNYDPDATRALRARDAKYAATEIFTWFGHEIANGKVKAIDAYLQIFALPDYQKFRGALLIILANPPKPIYSTPVDTTQQ